MKQRYHAVIFDMDGLLLDTERIALISFLETCEQFAIGDQTPLFMRCIGANQALTEKILKKELPPSVDRLAFGRTWVEAYRNRISNQPVPLKDGARQLLDRLSLLQIPAAVATSTETANALRLLRSAGILQCFEAVIGGEQVKNSKPHPDIYLKAAQVLGVNPETCLALEDSEIGIRSALAAGMTVIQIPDLEIPSSTTSSLGCAVLSTLRDVEVIITRALSAAQDNAERQ